MRIRRAEMTLATGASTIRATHRRPRILTQEYVGTAKQVPEPECNFWSCHCHNLDSKSTKHNTPKPPNRARFYIRLGSRQGGVDGGYSERPDDDIAFSSAAGRRRRKPRQQRRRRLWLWAPWRVAHQPGPHT